MLLEISVFDPVLCLLDGLFNQYISQQEYKPRWSQIVPKCNKGTSPQEINREDINSETSPFKCPSVRHISKPKAYWLKRFCLSLLLFALQLMHIIHSPTLIFTHAETIPLSSSLLFCRWWWWQQTGDEGRTSNGHWRSIRWDWSCHYVSTLLPWLSNAETQAVSSGPRRLVVGGWLLNIAASQKNTQRRMWFCWSQKIH